MKRFKAAFKAALVPAIVGIVALGAALVLILIGLTADENLTFLWIGLFVLIVAGVCFMITRANYKERLHAICPECEKYMGDSGETIHYSYQITDYKENRKSDGSFSNYTFIYSCEICCPHCGYNSTFEYKVTAKTQAEANTNVSRYLQRILKLNK